MTLRVQDALALDAWSGVVSLLPEPAAAATPVAGRLAGVRVVAGVRAPITDAAGCLLVVAAEVDRSDWLLDVLLRRAATARCGAVLLGGTGPLGRASAGVALRLALPVLGCADPLTAAVALEVHLALPELAASRLITRTSAACAAAGAGLDALLDGVAGALDRRLWLLDSSANVVAGHGPGPPAHAFAASGDRAAVTAWLAGPVPDGARYVHREVQTDHPRGAFVVLERAAGDDIDALMAALQVLAGTVAGRLATQRLTVERDARHRMSLFSELLRGGGRGGSDVPRRMLDLGWQLDGWHIGIRIDVPRAVDPVAFRPEVVRAFEDAGETAHIVEHGSGWGVWSTFPGAPTQQQVQAHASAVRRAQWLLRSGLPTVMGVGRAQSGPDGLVRSLGEAGDAARIATTRAAGGHLVHVDRLGLSQLLLAWTRTDTFAPATASLLDPLTDQPGALLETLGAYLDAESSTADTAAVIGVHRNTVAARIARVVELLGVDLADPDERLAVQLACRSLLSHR